MIKETIKRIEKTEKAIIKLMKTEKAQNKEFVNYMNILEHRIRNILIDSNVSDECIFMMIKGKISALQSFFMTDQIFRYDYFSLEADLLHDLNAMINKELKLRENE